MAGFMTRRESRKQYESIGGNNFNDVYKTQKDKLRQSGLRGRDLRQAARRAVIDDQNLTNIQNTALQNSEQYAPTENTIAGIAAAGYDQNEKQMQRDNYSFRQSLLNSQPIEVSLLKPAQIQTEQAQTPTGESVKVASTATETPAEQPTQQQLSSNPVEAFYQRLNQKRANAGLAQKDYSGNYTPQSQPATVEAQQVTDATVETPAPGQPAQIQSAQEETPVAPVQEKYKGQKDYDNLKFGQAFNQAMKDIGEGGIFYYKGKPIKLAYGKEDTAAKQILQNIKGAYDPTLAPARQMKKYKDALNPGTETSGYYERPSEFM